MKFLNLQTGYSFDGIWTENQQNGYIFWFPNEQSINMTYIMTIAAIMDTNDPLEATIEDNDVFSFIGHNNTKITIDGYTFNEPTYSNHIIVEPEHVGNKYIYVFNVSCCGKSAGEYICNINIGNEGYIKVGADLYGECESTYINLSNFGVEIPDTIQKAIYDSNVHEDFTDNILINRKFKELLSNYWDIVANKGSNKSLINSLKWFEWENKIKIKEICKHYKMDKAFFSDRNAFNELENKIEEYLASSIKTTYISLYCSMQEELDAYDEELNPKLQNVVLKWSKNDIQLKLSLLAQFFGTYFLPIHLSILHATIEDVVFTNTIKSIAGGEVKRNDTFGDFNYVNCNIKDGNIYKIQNVNTQVSDDTVFAIRYTSSEHLGVDIFPSAAKIDESNIKTFSMQYYAGPGVIIPIRLEIPNQNTDFVKHTIIDFNGKRYNFYNVFRPINGCIKINFNLLVKCAGDYNLNFTFILTSGKTISKSLNFSAVDVENININVYKVKSKDDSKGFTKEDFVDTKLNKYLFKIQNKLENSYYFNYLPYMTPDDSRFKDYSGIKLTRTVVIDVMNDTYTEHKLTFLRGVMSEDFLEFAKYDYTDNNNPKLKYLIYVSKQFYAKLPKVILQNKYKHKYDIIRNDLGFYPQFHYLEQMTGDSIDKYTISQYEAVCCAAEINTGNSIEEFRYGKLISESEWTFTNTVTGKTIEYPASSLQPFVADKSILDTGYYDIKFKYSLTNGITNEYKLNSAFRIKNV